jgi:hypothetical protein
MNKISVGIRNHKVVLLTGRTDGTTLQRLVYDAFPHVIFSDATYNEVRIKETLTCRHWRGNKPKVIIFHRCEQHLREIVKWVRKRQSKQAVVFVTDGSYTASTPLLNSIADVTASIGKKPDSFFSCLRKKQIQVSEVTQLGNVEDLLDQIHYTNSTDLELAMSLSDMDLMNRNVPQELVESCIELELTSPIVYTSTKSIHSDRSRNQLFFDTILYPLVTKRVGYMLPKKEILEYVRYNHDIVVSPGLMECPRDDMDSLLVSNVNDKIRAFVAFRTTRKRKTF